MARTDYTNRRYGKLVATKFIEKNKWGHSLWECKCDCGKTTISIINELNQGKKISCGCFHKEILASSRWKGHGEISGDYWSILKRNANARGIKFDLKIEIGWELFLIQNRLCALTGWPIALSRNIKKGDQTASLDRINSDEGYVEGNVQWLHKKVNICKHVLHNSEFIKLCKTVTLNTNLFLETKPL